LTDWTASVPPRYRVRVVIELNTLRALYDHGYRVTVFCRACGRHGRLDLPRMLANGQGDRAVLGLPLRCAQCGGRGELSILWSSGGSH